MPLALRLHRVSGCLLGASRNAGNAGNADRARDASIGHVVGYNFSRFCGTYTQ
jgi:hypothetical protein